MKTIGAKIDKLEALRALRKDLEAKAKELKDQSDLIEAELMEQMTKEGVKKASGRFATASISEKPMPHVENWDEVFEFIRKTKSFHLMQRRMSAPAYCEMLELGKKVPGVVPYTDRKLNLRSL